MLGRRALGPMTPAAPKPGRSRLIVACLRDWRGAIVSQLSLSAPKPWTSTTGTPQPRARNGTRTPSKSIAPSSKPSTRAAPRVKRRCARRRPAVDAGSGEIHRGRYSAGIGGALHRGRRSTRTRRARSRAQSRGPGRSDDVLANRAARPRAHLAGDGRSRDDSRRDDAERIAEAKGSAAWPNRALVERAFTASMGRDPGGSGDAALGRPTGDHARRARRAAGRGEREDLPGDPGEDHRTRRRWPTASEEGSQGQGIATEATRACAEWALAQDGVDRVTATTLPWHAASLRVMIKLGMVLSGYDHTRRWASSTSSTSYVAGATLSSLAPSCATRERPGPPRRPGRARGRARDHRRASCRGRHRPAERSATR